MSELPHCGVCGRPYHRYSTGDAEHDFNAVACVNGLLGEIARNRVADAAVSLLGKALHVIWDDSVLEAYGSEGMRVEDVSGPLETSSWGLCVVDEPSHLALAGTKSPEGLFQVLSIPRNMVRTIRVLEATKPEEYEALVVNE